MDIRNKFIQNGIPYDELDEQIIPLIDALNFNANMKTQFCCWGHKPSEEMYVIFDESINDDDILSLLEHFRQTDYLWINFNKWTRILHRENKIQQNWMMEFSMSFNEENDPQKIFHRDRVVDIIKEF